MVSNLGYNRKENSHHKHSGRHKIRANKLNHKYLIEFSWYQTIETICSTDTSAMKILTEKNTNIDTYKVEWMNPLAISTKDNSDDNPTWDESINGPHKEGYCSACKEQIITLNNKYSWEVVDREDWINVLPSTWNFKKNVTQTEASEK